MKSHIIVNESIIKDYKDDTLNLNVRLFTNDYYYDLDNYEIPLDLKGIENHLAFIDEVIIYVSTTFIDYVNVLLVLSFLRSNSYKNKVTVKYFNFTEKDFNKDNFLNISLTNKEYDNVDYLLTLLKLKKYIKEHNENWLYQNSVRALVNVPCQRVSPFAKAPSFRRV